MNKTVLGLLVGAGLGLLDGLSAWMTPAARPQMMFIVIGSTIKGVVTGAAAGFVAQRWKSLRLAIAAGVVVGFLLSTLAAVGQPGHYWEIVFPGMLVGVFAGAITQRYAAQPPSRDRSRTPWLVALMTVGCGPLLAGQTSTAADPFSGLSPLLGQWVGTSEGQPGKGTVRREYTRALNGRFIRVTNRSEYPPQDKNAKGEIHDDEGFISFDRSRKKLVFRHFHVEGFVNQYVEDGRSSRAKIVFTSEAIENLPPGFRARETFLISGADEFEEVFELAEPDQPFTVYSRTRLKRVK